MAPDNRQSVKREEIMDLSYAEIEKMEATGEILEIHNGIMNMITIFHNLIEIGYTKDRAALFIAKVAQYETEKKENKNI